MPTYAKDTHKIVTVEYITERLYCVPIEWELDDIAVRWGEFFYKDELQTPPVVILETDLNNPIKISEALDSDLVIWFDCEENP